MTSQSMIIWSDQENLVGSIECYIFQSSHQSPFSLLCYRFNIFRRSIYLDPEWAIYRRSCCTFSRILIKFKLSIAGLHAWTQYSTCGLTYVLCSMSRATYFGPDAEQPWHLSFCRLETWISQIGPRDGSDESSGSANYFTFTAFYYGSVEVCLTKFIFVAGKRTRGSTGHWCAIVQI